MSVPVEREGGLERIPLLMPFVFLWRIIVLIVVVAPQSLVGYWWCDDCRKKFSFRTKRYDEEACGYDGCYVIASRCEHCQKVVNEHEPSGSAEKA